jgi:hypothetical protein
MRRAPWRQSAGPKASASPIDSLTEPDFKFQAARFLRWREKNAKRLHREEYRRLIRQLLADIATRE